MEKSKKKCCICNKEFIGYGNNPEPVRNWGHCCKDCNNYVVTVRINNYLRDRKQ